MATAEQIDALLPQTQCAQCGYPGCRPYAEAIVAGKAECNQCPPGGEATVYALAMLLGRTPPRAAAPGAGKPPLVAAIVEADCIGCTKCLQVCPTDAIIGAAKLMHTVIGAECTGCGLCLPPCPVDCIELHPVAARPAPERARRRYRARQQRRQQARDKTLPLPPPTEPARLSAAEKKAVVTAAVRRAQARRAAKPPCR